MGAAIAQWICLRLPSCGPGFESQAHHLCFYHLYSYFVLHYVKKRMIVNKKRPGFGPFKRGIAKSTTINTLLAKL